MAKKITTEAIGSENWDKYYGAYGNMSEDIKALINDPDDKDATEKVYQGINHQMSFYPAAYIVLPYLTDLLDRKIEAKDIEWAEYCLFNIAMTIASDNVFARDKEHKINMTSDIKGNYKRCVKKVRKTAKRFYRTYKDQLEHKSESNASRLVFYGFGLPVYLFVAGM
ncbi:MAG: hypothetical protein E7546_00560 [Ruminococcaceae bacterium]|nr:hypothetical protein [Oscillospiraceae bacterium]